MVLEKKFCDILKEAREGRGISQAELAQRAGLQPSAISHFETAKRQPSLVNLKRLANALELSADYLLGRTTVPEISGPAVEQIFKDLSQMSLSDQGTLVEMAALLAQKNINKKIDE